MKSLSKRCFNHFILSFRPKENGSDLVSVSNVNYKVAYLENTIILFNKINLIGCFHTSNNWI